MEEPSNKREEIREGIDDILVEGIDVDGVFHCEKTVISLLAYLHSAGCVLKVEAGRVDLDNGQSTISYAVEPLIEEKDADTAE